MLSLSWQRCNFYLLSYLKYVRSSFFLGSYESRVSFKQDSHVTTNIKHWTRVTIVIRHTRDITLGTRGIRLCTRFPLYGPILRTGRIVRMRFKRSYQHHENVNIDNTAACALLHSISPKLVFDRCSLFTRESCKSYILYEWDSNIATNVEYARD